jgi:protoheme ferro-lyase
MADNLSSNRLVRNEQILRDKNVAFEEAIVKFSQGDDDVNKAPISFICECSVLDCDRRITTSIEYYRRQHKRKDRFIVFSGHSIPSLIKMDLMS